jgi:hypothetical protein
MSKEEALEEMIVREFRDMCREMARALDGDDRHGYLDTNSAGVERLQGGVCFFPTSLGRESLRQALENLGSPSIGIRTLR